MLFHHGFTAVVLWNVKRGAHAVVVVGIQTLSHFRYAANDQLFER